MKSIKNIKLLMGVVLLLQVGIGFARGNDWAERGQNIAEACELFASKSDSKLIEAAKKGNLEDLKSALNDPKTNINEIGQKSEMTALMHACGNGHKDMVELLLNKGAHPHIICGWGDNAALREAVKGGHTEIVKLLLDKRDTGARLSMGYALVEAAKKGNKDMVELLLDKGADPNVEADSHRGPDTGSTALIAASMGGHKNIVKLLLDKGANPNVETTISSCTALSRASWKGHKDIVKLLLDSGADPRIRNIMGATALEIAKSNGHKEIVQLIDKAIKRK